MPTAHFPPLCILAYPWEVLYPCAIPPTSHATSPPPRELDRRDSSPTPSSALPLRYLAYLASEVVRCAEMSSARDGPVG